MPTKRVARQQLIQGSKEELKGHKIAPSYDTKQYNSAELMEWAMIREIL